MKFKAIISILLFSLLTTTCKKETNPEAAPQTGRKISVIGQDESAGLKSTTLSELNVINWTAGDQIGLYCDQAGGHSTNEPYTAFKSGPTSAFTGAMTWGTLGSIHSFYAYYPYTPNVGGSPAPSTGVPISLSATQTQSGYTSTHIGALDFTVARASATPVVSGLVDVNLNFNHVFTLLEFNLKLASGSSTNLSSIELYSTDVNLSLNSTTIDLTQATPSGDISYTLASSAGTKKVTLTIDGVAELTTGTAISAYMMILPGNQVGSTSSDMTIKVTSVAGVAFVVKTGINFVRGKRYTIDLTALTLAPIIDADGNSYNTVTIGTQTWMKENLKTTKYKNGTAITNVIGNTAWAALTTEAYCWYNSGTEASPVYIDTYGALYNWYAVADSRGLCPTGWHMPSDADWTKLTTYLGGESVAGGKLKETLLTHWSTPNTGATNETGFTALPGGNRTYFDGKFISVGDYGNWWSSAQSTTYNAWGRVLSYNRASVFRFDYDKKCGFSVRCVRD